MKISLISAVSDNGAIGRAGGIPWHIAPDFKYFKQMTLGKVILMGHKTFVSLPKILPKREHVVLTNQKGLDLPGCHVFNYFSDVLKAYAHIDELMVIGGQAIYTLALPYADRLYITEVHQRIDDADTFFPIWDRAGYQEISRQDKAGQNGPDYSFVIYDRVQ